MEKTDPGEIKPRSNS